jgi:hypothetical protein
MRGPPAVERTYLAADTGGMPEDHPYRKNPSVADLMRKRAVEEAVVAAERANQKAALTVVERWNAEQSRLWSPTIRCAIAAGTPWLDVYCPGCRTSRALDIRTLDRHPLASVGSLVIGFRCSWCPGSAPMPVLTGLHAVPPAARWSKKVPVEFQRGRPLSPEELDMIRQQIEEGFDNIAEVDPEIRGIVARNWPHLLSKLPPEDD